MGQVADWLGDADRIAELGCRLAGAAVPVDRLVLYRRTLHPEVLGRATAWAPDRPVEIFDRGHGLELSRGYAGSPLDRAIAEGVACALSGREIDQANWRWADPLRFFGLATILLSPLPRGMALAIGTRREGGFTDAQRALIDRSVENLAKSANRRREISQ